MDFKSWPLEAKIGQLMMFGFKGTSVPDFVKKAIEEYNLGGIIHFARNVEDPKQLLELNRSLQAIASNSKHQPQLFISMDQEGGTVTRLTQGAAVAPSNMALGASNDRELVEKVCELSGLELRAVGVNMNLAPVLDVNNNPQNPVIGVRSLGEDPQAVTELGVAAIKGYQKHLAAVAKHFPGHGDTDLDSHLALPVIGHERARLTEVELRPFVAAIKAQVMGIMTAHVYFSAIEEQVGKPATLSYPVLTGLLREELGYDGLIMTDCMEMNAISKTYGTVEAAVMTIEAGADMVLISHLPELQQGAYEALLKAVRSGRISEERVDQSLKRILRAKAELGLLANEDDKPGVEVVGSSCHLEVMRDAIAQGITLVKDEGLLPLACDQPLLVIEPQGKAANIAEDVLVNMGTLSQALQAKGISQVNSLALTGELTKQQTNQITGEARKFGKVIIVTQDAHRNASQAALVNTLLENGVALIAVGARTPYEVAAFPTIPTYLAAYGSRSLVWDQVADCLLGKITAKGRLPVSIPGHYSLGHSAQ